MTNENSITLLRAHEIVATFHRQCAARVESDELREQHGATADDLDEWGTVHGSNPAWHIPLDGERCTVLVHGGEVVGFEGLALAVTRLLAWRDADPEFMQAAAEECMEAGVSSEQFERELWDALRLALTVEGLPDAGAVYARRQRDAETAAIARAGGSDLISLRPRTVAAFAPGNFAQRVREGIDLLALSLDDRRKLIVETPARMVDALQREEDWQAVPACFVGDARIVGSFNGVPVRQEHNPTGALILLAGEIVGVIYGGDQTPPESEHAGERSRGA